MKVLKRVLWNALAIFFKVVFRKNEQANRHSHHLANNNTIQHRKPRSSGIIVHNDIEPSNIILTMNHTTTETNPTTAVISSGRNDDVHSNEGTQTQCGEGTTEIDVNIPVDTFDPDNVVGTIHGEYPCIYQNWNGTLIAGSRAMMFIGSYFLFEKKLILQWDNICHIREGGVSSSSDVDHSATAGGDVAEVTMTDERIVHRFQTVSGSNTTKLWIALMTLQNESLLLDGDSNIVKKMLTPTESQRRASMVATNRQTIYRRRNSDPSRMSTVVGSNQSQNIQQNLMVLDYNDEDEHDDDTIDPIAVERSNGFDVTFPIHASATVGTSSSNEFTDIPADTTIADMKVSIINEADESSSAPKPTKPITKPIITSIAVSMEIAEIEKDTGKILMQPIQCTNHDDGINGKLYTGRLALYFTGKRYFWEHTQIVIHWSSVKSVKTVHVLVAEESQGDGGSVKKRKCVGISVTTNKNCTTKEYRFVNMDNADQVWASLTALHNDYESLRQKHRQEDECRNASPPLRRRNSDPFFRSSRIGFDSMSLLPEEEQEEHDNNNIDTVLNTDKINHLNRDGSNRNVEKNEASFDKMSSTSSSYVFASASSTASLSSHSKRGEKQIAGGRVGFLSEGQKMDKDQRSTSIDDRAGWDSATNGNADSKKMYSTVIIPSAQLNDCSDIDTFFDLFLSNAAKYSLFDKFLQTRGDTSIHVEEWKSMDNNGSKLHRNVKYIHPVNAPLAPPQATARREQTYYHYGSSTGILFESRTYVDDVPMADCFYVAERIMISPTNSNEATATTTLSVTIDFGITFVKSTMFKGIITKKTTSEVTELMHAMLKFIIDSLSTEKSAVTSTSSDICQVIEVTGHGEEKTIVSQDLKKQPQQQAMSPPQSPPEEANMPENKAHAVGSTRIVEKINALLNEMMGEINNIKGISQLPFVPILLSIVVVLLLFIALVQIRILSELHTIRSLLGKSSEIASFKRN